MLENSNFQTPGPAFYRLNAILSMVPVGRSTWWRRVKEGTYPQPIKLGPRTTVWRASDIEALIAELGGVK